MSGWDEQPVTHAQVTVGGRTWQPDATGAIVFDQDVQGQAIDIEAPGYLLRQTRVTAPTQTLTLWPAANPEEAEAIRAMAYRDGNSGLFRPDSPGYRITADGWRDMPIDAAAAAAQQVERSASRLSQLIGTPANAPWFQVFARFEYEPFEMLIDANQTATTCPSPWGFCRVPGYFRVSMVRERAGHPDVALRALAHILLRPNPLPGLMNLEQPADDLSLLEQQTIRMIFKRQVGNHWPDSDRQ